MRERERERERERGVLNLGRLGRVTGKTKEGVFKEGWERSTRTRLGFQGRFSNETITFYVTKFPDDWGTKELWKTFQRWGRVVDVFIPLKRNKIGDRFAFIRYQHVRDSKDLEKQLDKMIIGSTKVFVNLTKFNRNDKQGDTTTHRETILQKNAYNNKGGLSYAQALRQNANPQRPARGGEDRGKEEDPDWKGMTVRIEEKEWGWLKGAHVGKLRELEIVEGIHDAMQEEGITTIKTLHMGGDLMLLMPLEGEEIMEILKDTEEVFSNWFVYIKPWEENDIAGYRITWLNCGGIPLQAWNESFFKVLTSKFGSFLKTDNETRDRSRIDIARIQIKTSAQGFINTVLRIMINGKIFGIRIMEESLVQSNPKKYLEGGECCLDDTDTSFCDSSSEDSSKNCYKDIQDDLTTEWVPDSLEVQGSPNGVGRGQEEEDEQTERMLQLINAVNHGGESFHIENINKGGEVCSFNCSKENNESPKLEKEPNSNGKVVLNYGSGCENGICKSGPNIETEGVLGAGKFGPDYVLGGYDNACKGGPSFGIGGIEKDRFLSEGGEPGLCNSGLIGPNYTHNSENNIQFSGHAEANEIQCPILPLDSNLNGTADLEAAGHERTSNHQPNQ
ncbi:hypothetical protein RIF29_29340 [Crotalaria pallida]|uniref:RRM domain-containing protein n=1 Tax=Crotalaria pallida TaxID=3830 RepID=A0AAN9EEL4_CROPI